MFSWQRLGVLIPLTLGFLGIAATAVILHFERIDHHRATQETLTRELRNDATLMQTQLEHEARRDNIEGIHQLLSLENHHAEAVAALYLDESRTIVSANHRGWIGRPFEDVLAEVPALRSSGLAARVAAAGRARPEGAFIEPGTSWLVAVYGAMSPRTALRPLSRERSALFVIVRNIQYHLDESRMRSLEHARNLGTVMVLLVLVLGLFLHRRVTRRLGGINTTMDRFVGGDHKARASASDAGDEIDRVANGLNRLMDATIAEWRAREHMERTLRESEERFRRVFEEAGTGLVLVSGAGVIQRVNKAFGKFLGHEEEALVGRPLAAFESEEPTGSEALLLLDLKAGRIDSIHLEKSYRRADGRRAWAEQSVTLLGDARDPEAIILQVQDVTSRRETQKALDEVLELNQRILDSASPAILAFRSDGSCVFASGSAGRIFGVESGGLLGRNFRTWQAWKDAGLTAACSSVLARGGNQRCTVQLTVEGRRIDLDCTLSTFPRLDETHLLVLADDATERKQAEAALVSAARQATTGQLAAGVAHEFNNLLAVIRMQLEALRERPGVAGDPEAASVLATLESQAGRGAAIVRSLMNLARPAAVQKAVLPVTRVIAEILELQRRPLSLEEIEVKTEIEPDLGVRADPTQLQQVLLNLFLNARHALRATPSPKIIRLVASGESGMVRFEVTDNGCGMDSTVLSKATEPFYTTRGAEGTGLGLAMCQRIILQHGGDLTLRSRPLEGTTVAFSMPRAVLSQEDALTDHAEFSPGDDGRSAPGRERGRMLVVDDEEALVAGLTVFLRQRGFIVDGCTDAVGAGRAIASQEYDIALLDQTMPGTTGLELAAKLKARNPAAEIHMMSGHLDVQTMATDARAVGVRSILHKPFELSELMRALGAPGPAPEHGTQK